MLIVAGALAVAGIIVAAALPVYADDEGITATVSCDAAEGPGKVRCRVTTTATGGKIRWGDVMVLSAPDFAPALRTRLGPADATRHADDGAEFALALLARSAGVGKLRVVARGVICGRRGCLTVTTEATADVRVGATDPLDAAWSEGG
jgi:hypothetical protein